MLAFLFGIFAGALLPVQTSVNTRLRLSVGAPLLASLISFAVGTLSLFVASWISSGHPLPNFSTTAGHPWWIFGGGALGVVVLTGNILLFPRVGSVQTVILPVAGQIFMGLLIDALGLFNAPQLNLSATRVAGALAVLLGALLVVGMIGRKREVATPADGGGQWLWRTFGLVMGACGATQTAVNGHLGTILGSAVGSALTSFSIGVLCLLVLVLLTRTPWRGVAKPSQGNNPWWMWSGGVLGATLVFANAFLAPTLGTGLTVVLTLSGMMAASLMIDVFGLLGSAKVKIRPTQLLGLLVIIIGVILIRLF